jgi:protein-L-isoaspartate O-methyltransferase
VSPDAAVFFEDGYRANIDPWDYTHSLYERAKYETTLEACGPGPFECALELGASIGVFSALLAPRCLRLDTIDGAPTAVEAARARLVPFPQVEVRCGPIPEAIPARPFDLVVASEILYYLDGEALDATLDALSERMLAGGRLVAVHWRPPGPERPLHAETVHAALRSQDWLAPLTSSAHPEYLLDVLERA